VAHCTSVRPEFTARNDGMDELLAGVAARLTLIT